MNKKILVVILLLISSLSAQYHFTPIWTSTPYLAMNIYVTSVTLDGIDLGTGDEIGIFDGAICVGAGVLTETIPTGGYLALIASTDDPTTTEIDGFTVGNAITFVVWDTSAMEESDICGSTFSVGDGNFSSLGTAMVNLSCPPPNEPPVANAGTDMTVDENSIVTLDGSGSYDPDGDPITYLWTVPAGITLSSATVVNPTFTAPEVQSNTDYTFTLVVNDGSFDSSPDDVIITIEDVPNPPVADAGTDQTVAENSIVQLDGTGSYDPDGDAITFLWTASAGIVLSSVTDSTPTFTAPEVQSNVDYTFTLVVNDGSFDSSPDDVIITIEDTTLYVDEFDMPSKFVLYPNYPNPFNPTTILHFDLPERAQVTISIYSLQGQLVKFLLNSIEEPGYKSVVWDATDQLGKPVSAGVYLYQIRAGDFVQTCKMVLLK